MADIGSEGNAMRNTATIATLAVVLLAVGIMVVMGSLITEVIMDTDQVTTLESKDVANATETNASTMTLGHNRIIPSTLVVWNGTYTGGTSVNFYNLTCSGTTLCTLSINNYTEFELAENFTVAYSWNEEQLTVARNVTESGLGALDTVSEFLPIVGIVAIAGVIVAIISTSFTGGGV